jgi:histone-lysine N-methyltransferase SETMAR
MKHGKLAKFFCRNKLVSSSNYCTNPTCCDLVSIFWNQDGILLIDYLPKGQTINPENYSSLLVQMKDIFKKKNQREGHQVVLFLHDNAPIHRALATQKKMAYLGFQCLDHPPYSPDLAPSD